MPMAIKPDSLISLERITDLKGTKKEEVLDELIELLATSKLVTDREELRAKVFERERTVSTGVGYGIAVPHVKIPSIKGFVAAVGRSKAGVDFDSLDGAPTHIVVMIGCNNTQSGDFLKVLAQIVMRLRKPDLLQKISDAKSMEEIRDIFIQPNGVLV